MKKYLALGDSYTIGESLPSEQNFPHQLVDIFGQHGISFSKPQIIAITGWTTDELSNAIAQIKPDFNHDLVTLLIGVNNQYRGRSTDEYYWQFYSLLCQAILFAKSIPENVCILSIPDWGLTPFNKEKDKKEVSAQIDNFNAINKEISNRFGCRYVDVTASTRNHAENEDFLANDLLHYSAQEYKIWAELVYEKMKDRF